MTKQELHALSVMVDFAHSDARRAEKSARDAVRNLARIRDAVDQAIDTDNVQSEGGHNV